MKKFECMACGKEIEVDEDYEPEYCCEVLSNACYCMGKPINPVFCDKCEEKIFGKRNYI
ncbi:MAG: hypothetical protein PHI22_04485 [Bacilli bacterium]|nr:hypothetical protein [Bacilli bacterium]